MALLSAEDVLNKTFPETKFRPGYDQDEVDDFLDEVVNTLRALYAENEDLKAKLAAAGTSEAPVPAAEEAPVAEQVEPEPHVEEPAAEEAPAEVSEPEAAPFAAAAPVAPSAPEAGGVQTEPEAATGMLALASRLHDEYIQNGKNESERLINEATTQANAIVAEANETKAQTMAQLDQERSLLERKIDELRIFERDYRTRLRSYLENLLGDLENRGSALPQSPLPGQLS